MSFNRQIFKTRALTAVVFVIVMGVGVLWNAWSFFILFSVIHFGCWLEYQRLVGKIDPEYQKITQFHKYGVMIAGCCLTLWFCDDRLHIFGVRLHELGWWMGLLFIFVLPLTELLLARNVRLKNIGHSAFGLVYISLSLGLMMNLNTHSIKLLYANHLPAFPFGGLHPTGIEYKWNLPVLVIGALWVNDTMAYLVGSMIGKTPFSKISPKKTWEGTIGGLIFTVGLAWLIAYLADLNFIPFMITAAVAAIAGTAGDLLQSKLKRLAGVKDSGTLMPGHGGFLDRFDSLLIAVPFVWLFVEFFVKTYFTFG